METVKIKVYPSYFMHKVSFYIIANNITINWGNDNIEEYSLNAKKKHIVHKYANHEELQSISIEIDNLIYFNCDKGDFTDVEFGDCPSLKEIICNNNEKLCVLTILNAKSLEKIECYNSILTSLDLNNCEKINYINCSNNLLTKLDLCKNTLLSELYCNNNSLNSLDLSENNELTELDCSNNSLTNLELGTNDMLKVLNCENNTLTSLDISKNTSLHELYCAYNKLTSLDVRNNIILTKFDCDNNQFVAQSVKIKRDKRNIFLNPISFSIIYCWEI